MEVGHASTPITLLRSAEHGEAPSGSRACASGATGLLFLPIPLVEAYAKAGLARMQGTVHATPDSPRSERPGHSEDCWLTRSDCRSLTIPMGALAAATVPALADRRAGPIHGTRF